MPQPSSFHDAYNRSTSELQKKLPVRFKTFLVFIFIFLFLFIFLQSKISNVGVPAVKQVKQMHCE